MKPDAFGSLINDTTYKLNNATFRIQGAGGPATAGIAYFATQGFPINPTKIASDLVLHALRLHPSESDEFIRSRVAGALECFVGSISELSYNTPLGEMWSALVEAAFYLESPNPLVLVQKLRATGSIHGSSPSLGGGAISKPEEFKLPRAVHSGNHDNSRSYGDGELPPPVAIYDNHSISFRGPRL